MTNRFLADKKNIVISLLSALFIINIPHGGIRFIFWVLGGVALAGAFDFLIKRFLLNQKIVPKSSIISGFILSGILDYRQPWFILVIFVFLAIISKYIIRFKKKHIFNPANFGLFIATLFRQPLTWNIESNIYLIIIVGVYIVVSIKKWPHVLGFLCVFSGLFYFSGINPFNLMSWFFVFIMLIEPKTSGFGTWKGLSFGGIVALTSFIVFKFMPQIDIFVTSLVVANIFNAALTIKRR